MTRLGMIIDLEKCYGCDACAMACRDEHLVPADVHFVTVLKSRDHRCITVPTLCMHCDDPICMSACPYNALFRDDEGVVVVRDDVCTGCGECTIACPYGAMVRSSLEEPTRSNAFMSTRENQLKERWATRRKRRIPAKCDFCETRRRNGRLPACAAICPQNAYLIGDLDNPSDPLARLVASGSAMAFSRQGASPRVFYRVEKTADLEVIRHLMTSTC